MESMIARTHIVRRLYPDDLPSSLYKKICMLSCIKAPPPPLFLDEFVRTNTNVGRKRKRTGKPRQSPSNRIGITTNQTTCPPFSPHELRYMFQLCQTRPISSVESLCVCVGVLVHKQQLRRLEWHPRIEPVANRTSSFLSERGMAFCRAHELFGSVVSTHFSNNATILVTSPAAVSAHPHTHTYVTDRPVTFDEMTQLMCDFSRYLNMDAHAVMYGICLMTTYIQKVRCPLPFSCWRPLAMVALVTAFKCLYDDRELPSVRKFMRGWCTPYWFGCMEKEFLNTIQFHVWIRSEVCLITYFNLRDLVIESCMMPRCVTDDFPVVYNSNRNK